MAPTRTIEIRGTGLSDDVRLSASVPAFRTAAVETDLIHLVLGCLHDPPALPDIWLTVDFQGSERHRAPSRQALLAHYAGRGIDVGDAVAVCPSKGPHDNCAWAPDCHGECVGSDMFVADDWLSIINLANIPAVPVVRRDAVGFAAVGWHTHRDPHGPTGGEPDYPDVDADSRHQESYPCGGPHCDSRRFSSKMVAEIGYRILDNNNQPLPISERARALIVSIWQDEGDRVIRSLQLSAQDNGHLLGLDRGDPRPQRIVPPTSRPARAAPRPRPGSIDLA